MEGDLFLDLDIGEVGYDPEVGADRERFSALIWDFYRLAGRRMPWRDDPNPYWVFVSEIMLQQTQVSRVMQKFPPFVERFPDFMSLASSPFSEVLLYWSGLGYNRRAKFMHRSASSIMGEHAGRLPDDPDVLRTLPGIGVNTAGSIAAFAYNRPVVFIETNIRRVFLHLFFPGEEEVHDRRIFPLIDRTLPRDNPREWYWALMDFGVELARRTGNSNRRSAHYTRQKPFEDSDRQLRGRVLRALTERGAIVAEEVPEYTGFAEDRVRPVLERMRREGLIRLNPDGRWSIED